MKSDALDSVRGRLASARADRDAAAAALTAAQGARGLVLLAPEPAALKSSATDLIAAERKLADCELIVSALAIQERQLVRVAAAAELREARAELSELEDRRQAVFAAVWAAKKEIEAAEQSVGIAERLKSEWNMQLDNARARVRSLEAEAVKNG